jgi:hypothetical protein
MFAQGPEALEGLGIGRKKAEKREYSKNYLPGIVKFPGSLVKNMKAVC